MSPVTPVTPATPTPTANPVPPKTVMAPPPPVAGPMHKHTGFIIAISIAVILLIVSGIMAYMNWSQGEGLRNDVMSLNENNVAIAAERDQALADLITAEEALAELGEPIPYVYLSSENPFITPTEFHTVNPITGEDKVVASVEGWYTLITQPKVNWTGDILVDRLSEGDNPSYTPFIFNVDDGESLTPAPAGSSLPIGRSSSFISPDGQYFAAIFDNSDTEVREFAFIDAMTGEKVVTNTLTGGQRYASEYQAFAGLGQFTGVWTTHECFQVWVHGSESDADSGDITLKRYCISDYIQ